MKKVDFKLNIFNIHDHGMLVSVNENIQVVGSSSVSVCINSTDSSASGMFHSMC